MAEEVIKTVTSGDTTMQIVKIDDPHDELYKGNYKIEYRMTGTDINSQIYDKNVNSGNMGFMGDIKINLAWKRYVYNGIVQDHFGILNAVDSTVYDSYMPSVNADGYGGKYLDFRIDPSVSISFSRLYGETAPTAWYPDYTYNASLTNRKTLTLKRKIEIVQRATNLSAYENCTSDKHEYIYVINEPNSSVSFNGASSVNVNEGTVIYYDSSIGKWKCSFYPNNEYADYSSSNNTGIQIATTSKKTTIFKVSWET